MVPLSPPLDRAGIERRLESFDFASASIELPESLIAIIDRSTAHFASTRDRLEHPAAEALEFGLVNDLFGYGERMLIVLDVRDDHERAMTAIDSEFFDAVKRLLPIEDEHDAIVVEEQLREWRLQRWRERRAAVDLALTEAKVDVGVMVREIVATTESTSPNDHESTVIGDVERRLRMHWERWDSIDARRLESHDRSARRSAESARSTGSPITRDNDRFAYILFSDELATLNRETITDIAAILPDAVGARLLNAYRSRSSPRLPRRPIDMPHLAEMITDGAEFEDADRDRVARLVANFELRQAERMAELRRVVHDIERINAMHRRHREGGLDGRKQRQATIAATMQSDAIDTIDAIGAVAIAGGGVSRDEIADRVARFTGWIEGAVRSVRGGAPDA